MAGPAWPPTSACRSPARTASGGWDAAGGIATGGFGVASRKSLGRLARDAWPDAESRILRITPARAGLGQGVRLRPAEIVDQLTSVRGVGRCRIPGDASSALRFDAHPNTGPTRRVIRNGVRSTSG